MSIKLINAVIEGDLQTVKTLVKMGDDVTALRNYAIGQAAYYGQLEVVKYLVEKGADVTAKYNGPIPFLDGKK